MAVLGLSAVAYTAPLDAPLEARDAGGILADLQAQAMENLKAAEADGTISKREGCNLSNAFVRKDWAAFSIKERKEYISAVQCMLTSPSKSDPSFAPGARNRYDDFVAVHINQTSFIHGTGNFLTWHRYYTWAYENALKTECGYKGTQPYWNWFADTDDPRKSPVYDGSETSLSGDGAYVPHNGSVSLSPFGEIFMPSGHGGGCMHAAGHFVANGDASDLYASPTDPTFFLHHAMVDHLYWLWQALHLRDAFEIAGTITILNLPPSRNATKEDIIEMGVLTQNRPIKDFLAQTALDETKSQIESGEVQKRGSICTWHNVRVRREWLVTLCRNLIQGSFPGLGAGSLSRQEKLDYIKAAKCLQSKPPRTPSSEASGAKTRFDDFVANHINQTLTIHYTGNFLSWHRYFTWLYEEALGNECGYKGTQPYWDWAKTAITGMEESPIFDGSETSMSGNGELIPGGEPIVLGGQNDLPPVELPVGTGGGCITSGPFKDMVVNLGPAALDLPGGISESNPEGPLSYNPRCLKRDLTTDVNRAYANITAVLSNILQPQNVYDFQMQMQGVPGSGNIERLLTSFMPGIHGGGHYALGGDPGRDVFTSPGDPVFYLHHSMIDRVWWMWQMLSPHERQYGEIALSGTHTFLNQPPSANATMDDYLEYGYVGGQPLKIRDAMSTVAGPFCYVYL
ncbi:tyrosinase-like protein orsC [Colletotrichum spaethianum]|uniref:Tyrosinase-like protein orsC n=1 Tax=Colletotrichum spaethianum TaxID=700344 RepID=A0AA37L8J5_9PEZI|nr:tyrosinase-like protein orsC [Colletotrichum spaethianum]GKT41954.1 tyrosinase-like protein orsC [Colletotrichum spaethianum]